MGHDRIAFAVGIVGVSDKVVSSGNLRIGEAIRIGDHGRHVSSVIGLPARATKIGMEIVDAAVDDPDPRPSAGDVKPGVVPERGRADQRHAAGIGPMPHGQCSHGLDPRQRLDTSQCLRVHLDRDTVGDALGPIE